mmetsp:Transcript_3877/g.8468  ORF Transcript_3877/g.8468 Transcript_3877/m.8468 type:complete len:235 (+) Transcript_3877:299-1003(+)
MRPSASRPTQHGYASPTSAGGYQCACPSQHAYCPIRFLVFIAAACLLATLFVACAPRAAALSAAGTSQHAPPSPAARSSRPRRRNQVVEGRANARAAAPRVVCYLCVALDLLTFEWVEVEVLCLSEGSQRLGGACVNSLLWNRMRLNLGHVNLLLGGEISVDRLELLSQLRAALLVAARLQVLIAQPLERALLRKQLELALLFDNDVLLPSLGGGGDGSELLEPHSLLYHPDLI